MIVIFCHSHSIRNMYTEIVFRVPNMKLHCGILAVFLWILLTAFCIESSNIFIKWTKINTTDTTYGTSMSVEGQLSASQCLAKCSATTGCVSANVHRENLQCELSTDHPLNRSLSPTHRPGWSVYYTGELQTISQWVQNVTDFSSQFDSTGNSANQVIGLPDVNPWDNSNAWVPGICDSSEFLQVQFAEAVYITGVEVYETYRSGGVIAIKALDGLGNWITLWSTSTVEIIYSARIFAPVLSVAMNSPSRDVFILVNCTADAIRSIDAVQLIGIK